MNKVNRFGLALEIQAQSQTVHWSGDRHDQARAFQKNNHSMALGQAVSGDFLSR
jgi:hypothetical protein|tara:strand:+ start:169 stop:330 length:162 start_codon:yes stop_codon:yes gene_type:complete